MANRSRIVKLIIGVVALCLVGTAVILFVSRIFFGSVLKEPTTVAVQIEAPAQVVLNEPFSVTLQLTNLITASQTLHSIDVDNSYLENIRLQGAVPAYREVQTLPLTRFTSFAFGEEIPVDGQIDVELLFVGSHVGNFVGVIDICLADGTFCLALPLETAVIN